MLDELLEYDIDEFEDITLSKDAEEIDRHTQALHNKFVKKNQLRSSIQICTSIVAVFKVKSVQLGNLYWCPKCKRHQFKKDLMIYHNHMIKLIGEPEFVE